MTNLEHQQHIVNLLENSLAGVCEASRIEQRLSHERHHCPLFAEVEDKLKWLLDLQYALLRRIETVGR